MSEKQSASDAIAATGTDLFDLWAASGPSAAAMAGRASTQVGLPLEADAERISGRARGLLERLDRLDVAALSLPDELTSRYLTFELGKLAGRAGLHRFQFEITPYQIGSNVSGVHHVLSDMPLTTPEERARYEDLVRQYRVYVRDVLVALRVQAAQGILLPKPAIPGTVATLKAFCAAADAGVTPGEKRLAHVDRTTADAFLTRIKSLAAEIRNAFGALIAHLEGDYARSAPDAVGLSQYAGGGDAYTALIFQETTQSLSPEQLHKKGIALIAEIEDAMAEIRGRLGINADGAAFLEQVAANQRFYCQSPEEVGALYSGLLKKCEAVLPKAFAGHFPAYRVERLTPGEEEGMTFGYYQPPSMQGGSLGVYKFNGSKLNERNNIGAASLIYHEILPGHHLHIGTEMSDAARPLYRRMPSITAFNEGWAEYAADLGWELGLYEDPYDQYGRLLMRSFLASRLVVDTGLNAFGWSLERARAYMHAHSSMSATEIASETLRYSTGLPGQALGYALGREHFWAIRHRAESALGANFVLPEFHSAILRGGSLPLDDVAWGIERWTAARLEAGREVH